MRFCRAAAISVLGLALALALNKPASAQQIITALSNLPGTDPYTSGDFLGNNGNNANARQYAAVQLTNNGSAVTLVDVMARFANTNTVANRVVTGGMYTSVGGNPGALVVAFNQQTIAPTAGVDVVKTFIPASSTVLNANTDYWFVFTADVGTFDGTLNWRRDTANTAPTTAPNFATSGYKVSADNAATWGLSTNNNKDLVQIRVAASPEPSSLALLGLAGIGVVGVKRRRR